MAGSGWMNDKTLEWMRSFPINEDGEDFERKRIVPKRCDNSARRNVTFGDMGVADNMNYPRYYGTNQNDAATAAYQERLYLISHYNMRSYDDQFFLPRPDLSFDKDTDFPNGVLPKLEDKGAKSLFLYRDEAKNINRINIVDKVTQLVLVVSQLEEERSFSRLCNEHLANWYKLLDKTFIPVPSKYYNETDYFWIIVNSLKKVHRRFFPEPFDVMNKLASRFNVKLTSNYKEAKYILQKEFEKFMPIYTQVKGIENFFKCISKYELLESEYTENHKKIAKLLQQLNMVKHDLSPIGLSPYHKLSFIKDLQLTKKRFYVFICRLDAHMKRSADRTHALRIASCGQFVEIVIEQAPPEPEPESDPEESLSSDLEDSDSDTISILDSSAEGWHRFPRVYSSIENNDVDNNPSDNRTENTNQEVIYPIGGVIITDSNSEDSEDSDDSEDFDNYDYVGDAEYDRIDFMEDMHRD